MKRTLKQRLFFFVLFGLIMFLTWFLIRFFTIDQSLTIKNTYTWPELPSISRLPGFENSEYAIAIDGNVVTERDFENRPTASTAKMILGLAIMQHKPFEFGETGEFITINSEDYDRYIWYANHEGTNTAVQIGAEISEYDALISVFLASSNNMADTLAIWAFGSIDDYRNYATKMLQEWGITQTVIGDDASGFRDSTTSTAADLAMIGAKVLENPVLAEIVKTKSYTVPIAGTITNTNEILGINNIIGVKTGYIGDVSGYCLISGYKEGEHIVTISVLNADTRVESFSKSLEIVRQLQEILKKQRLVSEGQIVGYLESWWIGSIPIRATEDFEELAYTEAEKENNLEIQGDGALLTIKIAGKEYNLKVDPEEYNPEPTLSEKIQHVFGWKKEITETEDVESNQIEQNEFSEGNEQEIFTNAPSDNCTVGLGELMLINPNFTVDENFISARQNELVSLSSTYGIIEGNPYNGDNMLDPEAAIHMNEMISAYKNEYPGHTIETRSCFRAKGTNCGRLCAATGASDHHTGLTCDLLDPVYGTLLDTSTYDQHIEWQWLRANSYKYGFIDRFPEAWAGGSMDEPLNVDESGSTGLYETWHYRYVGAKAATEIATGKYNNGQYDSLEHYLKSRGLVFDLKNGLCN